MDMRKRVQLNDDEIRLILSWLASYYRARLKSVRRELKEYVKTVDLPEGSGPEDIQRLKREVYKQKFEGELKGLRKLLKKLNRALTGSYALRLSA